MAEWVPLGDRAILFDRPAGVSARALVRACRAWPGAIDVVVARNDIAVYFAGPPSPGDLGALARLPADDEPVREVVLRASYTGEDLDEGCIALAGPKDVKSFVDALAALRMWEREPKVKLA